MRQPRSASSDDRSVVILAASSRGAARAYADAGGHRGATVIDRFELVSGGGRLDRLRRADGPLRVIVHSLDWSREEMPQVYLVALARSAVAEAWLADEAAGDELIRLSRGQIRLQAAATIPQVARGLGRSAAEIARAARAARRVRPGPARLQPRSVAAVWSGALGSQTGGSVSHAAGILGGFRELGLRVELVADMEPPPQLAASIDGLTLIEPLPPAHRLTREVRRLAANGPVRGSLRRVLAGLDAPFVYARHQAMSTAAADVAAKRGVPLVLEWNASEVWAVQNWTRMPARMKRVVVPTIGLMERSAVRRATVVAAVSTVAGDMAIEAGAGPQSLLIVPNAADPAAVDAVTAGRRSGEEPEPEAGLLLGWVGSFGAWHGAPVLIEAMARASTRPRAVLVGDGVELEACIRLADELGVRDRVRFAGHLSHDDALRTLAACDVLVAPNVPLSDGSPFFGSPTKIFEYMALGLPIVASELGQIGDVLTDGVTARLVPPGSVDDLAAALDELGAAPATAAALGREARLLAEREHTWAHRAGAIVEALGDG